MREQTKSDNLFIDEPAWARRDRSLYPEAYGLVDANGHRKVTAHESITPILPPGRDYTDEEWSELGERMAANPKAIVTNIEGKAYLDYTNNQRRELMERYGCCGEEPDASGYCFGMGRCQRHHETQACLTFVANVIAWLDQINEQTSLAAVAVRLSDPSPISNEASNV